MNTRPKYLVSNTLTEPRWADTTVLSGDVAAAIGELKAKPGGELQVHGSGALIRWLLDNDLVDEMTLLIVPVVLGQGARLFPDAGPDIALDLVDSRADSKGVTIQVYRPAGRPRYATATADRDVRMTPRTCRELRPFGPREFVPMLWTLNLPSPSALGTGRIDIRARVVAERDLGSRYTRS